MPTGYTQILNDKPDTTFQEFALRCARAMGALVMMRDEPLDAPIPDDVSPVSTYYTEALQGARADYERYRAMRIDEAERLSVEEYEQAIVRHSSAVAENEAQRERYEAMLAQVRAWEPPTSDHQGFKDYMVKQLEESIQFDCGYTLPAPVQLEPQAWLQGKIAKAIRDIEYNEQYLREDEQRSRERNAWVKALRESL
jgi:hypothetical protein